MTVAIEPQPARKRALKSRAVLDKQIADIQSWTARVVELKGLIQESNKIIEGLSARVMKHRRDPDDILDKGTREKFKREEHKKIEVAKARN